MPTFRRQRSTHIVIAGAGCSGLAMADALDRALPADTTLTVVDPALDHAPPKTWSFWGPVPPRLAPLISKTWHRARISFPGWSRVDPLNTNAYHRVEGAAYHAHFRARLEASPRVRLVHGSVERIDHGPDDSCDADQIGADVLVNGEVIPARWVFQSCRRPVETRPGRSALLQHFGGWEIETEHDVFDPQTFTLMDFDLGQVGATTFRYLLPLTPRRALIEHTVFSRDAVERESYDVAVQQWIDANVAGPVRVVRREYGAIPMTDAEFPQQTGTSVFNLGTAGGMTKPTTGYTFTRIQAQVQHLTRTLVETGRPEPLPRTPGRFAFYDSLLLRILEQRPELGRPIFEHLFRRNRVDGVLTFLGERTRLHQELKILSTLPLAPFLGALAGNVKDRRALAPAPPTRLGITP